MQEWMHTSVEGRGLQQRSWRNLREREKMFCFIHRYLGVNVCAWLGPHVVHLKLSHYLLISYTPGLGRRLMDNLPLLYPKENRHRYHTEQLGLRQGFKSLQSSPCKFITIFFLSPVSFIKGRQGQRPNPSSPNYSVHNSGLVP